MFSGRMYSHHAHTVDYAATKNTEIDTMAMTKDIDGTLAAAVLLNRGIDALPSTWHTRDCAVCVWV